MAVTTETIIVDTADTKWSIIVDIADFDTKNLLDVDTNIEIANIGENV